MFQRILFVVLSLFLVCPFWAYATTIKPSSSDLNVMPGQPATATIVVSNDVNVSKYFEVSVVQVQFSDRAEELSFLPLASDLNSGISISPSSFELAASSSRIIEIVINLPARMSELAPTLAVLVTERTESGERGSVRASVASLLFLHVSNGDPVGLVEISSFTTVPSFTLRQDTMLSAVFKNDSADTLILPNELRIFGPFGQEISREPFSAELKHLPAGTMRSLTLLWPAKKGFSSFLLGPYRFELWDGNNNLAQTTVTFLPAPLLTVSTVALALVLLGIIISVRRRM